MEREREGGRERERESREGGDREKGEREGGERDCVSVCLEKTSLVVLVTCQELIWQEPERRGSFFFCNRMASGGLVHVLVP